MRRTFRDILGENILIMLKFIPDTSVYVRGSLTELHNCWYNYSDNKSIVKDLTMELISNFEREKDVFPEETKMIFGKAVYWLLREC